MTGPSVFRSNLVLQSVLQSHSQSLQIDPKTAVS